MIKIFGKLRYHWQPELSIFIIYWSFVMTPFLVYFILRNEQIKIPNSFLFILFFCSLFIILGFRRYFIIEEGGNLRIVSANPFNSCLIDIASIDKIEVTYSSITIFSDKFPKGRTFYMRKWPKKYFINAIVLEPNFKGQVILTDHLIKLDYFELYYSKDSKK